MSIKRLFVFVIASAMLVLASGVVSAQETIDLWYHGAGNPEERAVLVGIIEDFNINDVR